MAAMTSTTGTPTGPPLHERDRELATLGVLTARVERGVGGGVLIQGPPGIGKSRLLAATVEHGSSPRVVRARGSQLERDIAFGLVRQLLEPMLRGAAPGERADLLDGPGALADRVLGDPVTGLRAGAEPIEAASHGLYWLVANAAAQAPLLMLVDDVHWADLPSLRWLAYLGQRLEGLPAAFVLTSRDEQDQGGAAVLDTIASLPYVEVLRPRPLSESTVGALVEQTLGPPVAPSFVAACRRVTGGNPFLVGELLGELARGEVAATDGNAAAVARFTSRGVGRAALERLRRLPRTCRSLAYAVVVLGDGTALPQAAALADLGEAEAADAADALAAAYILDHASPLGFVHPLVRASVYAELGPGERDRWHRRAATALADADASSDRIVVHLLATAGRGDQATVERLRDAARVALARGAVDVATSYLCRAWGEPPDAATRAWVAFELGAVQMQAGDLAGATEHLELASRELTAAPSRALATVHLGGTLLYTAQYEQAVTALGAAAAALGDHDRELGLQLEVLRCSAAQGSLAAWTRVQAQPARVVIRSDSPSSSGERLYTAQRALQAAHDDRAERAVALARSALAGGHLYHDPGPGQPAFYVAPIALLMAGALDEATQVLDEVLEWARRTGSTFAFSQASHLRAITSWSRGALAEAEADAEQALPYPSFMVRPGVIALTEVRLARGDVESATEVWQRFDMDREATDHRAAASHLSARAHLRAARGDVHGALDDLSRCARTEQDWGVRTPVYSSWRSDAALLLNGLGRIDEARVLAQEGIEPARHFGRADKLGLALRVAGTVIGGEAGTAHLREAVAVLAGSPAHGEHALALVELGAALRRGGRRTAAREPLREGLELARRCGAGPLAERAHDELVTAGARPHRDPHENRTTLTASELRVARRAATGLSNREIAQALFLTEKTIEVHLTGAYRKLGIASRTQLARHLPRDPARP